MMMDGYKLWYLTFKRLDQDYRSFVNNNDKKNILEYKNILLKFENRLWAYSYLF